MEKVAESAVFQRIVRVGLSEEEASEQWSEWSEGARVLQAEGGAGAKALRWGAGERVSPGESGRTSRRCD